MTTPVKIVKLDERMFKRTVNETSKVKTLLRIQALATEASDEKQLDVTNKRIRQLVRDATRQEDIREFKARIALESRYTTLNRYRSKYIAESNAERLRAINRRIQELLAEGSLKTRRRKPNTGARVERTFKYTDTTTNQKLGRVGKEYKRVVWEDAEYEEFDRKIRKRRIKKPELAEGEEAPPKRLNLWIEAVRDAKLEFDAPKFLIVRREATDPNDAVQKIGVKVYKRAIEIMATLKAKKALEAENATECDKAIKAAQPAEDAAVPMETN